MIKLYSVSELNAHSLNVLDVNRSCSYLWHSIVHANSSPLVSPKNDAGKVKYLTAAEIKRLVGSKYFMLLPIRKEKGDKNYTHNRQGSADMFCDLQKGETKYESICEFLEKEFNGVPFQSSNDSNNETFKKFCDSVKAYLKSEADKKKAKAQENKEKEEKEAEKLEEDKNQAETELNDAIAQSWAACEGEASNPYGQNKSGWEIDYEGYKVATKAAELMKDCPAFNTIFTQMLTQLETLSSDLRLVECLKEHTSLLEVATA